MTHEISPYPYRVVVTIVDAEGKSTGNSNYACFNTLKQAEYALEVAAMAAYELEPANIEAEPESEMERRR